MSFKANRTPGYTGKGDKALPKIHRELKYMLKKLQKPLDRDDPLKLPVASQDQLAGLLVELAEDLHHEIGIWRSYEHYNLEFFDTPLPFHVQPGEEVEPEELFLRRIQHFLWGVLPVFDPDLVLSPTYSELEVFSETIAPLLIEKFADVPLDSGVKKFLHEPCKYGWEVKRRLVWMGMQSYLFRFFLGNYVEEQGGELNIPTIDDFICQETTTWSGLGVIDILAGLLDISDEQRQELRSWYERHLAIYKVKSLNLKRGVMKVVNILNDKPYTIQGGKELEQFRSIKFVVGSLVPWHGKWYWSGGQNVLPAIPKKELEQMKQEFMTKMSKVVYRYCDDLAEKARETVQNQYDDFVQYHGSDLLLYPDGAAFAKDAQKQMRAYNEKLTQHEGVTSEHKSALEQAIPDFSLQFEDMQNGVAVFFNPQEGQELMQGFNLIRSGFEKQGWNMTADEAILIREFLCSDAISPQFVHRVIREYGHESIAAAFFIEEYEDSEYVEYLLRKYKGHFYRKRYPEITFV